VASSGCGSAEGNQGQDSQEQALPHTQLSIRAFSQGWAIAHFENERSLFFFEQKVSDVGNCSFFAHFCSFALFERAIERAIALL